MQDYVDLTYVIYGLAFFSLGVVTWVLPRDDKSLSFSAHMGWLAAFGMLHGLMEFVEDDPASLRLVGRLIASREDLALFVAENGEDGLDIIARERPDLILLDITLPGMSGYEVLERLQQDPAMQDTPVIAVTSNAMCGDIERGQQAGFAEYITKPLDIKTFFAVIDRQLKLDQSEQDIG